MLVAPCLIPCSTCNQKCSTAHQKNKIHCTRSEFLTIRASCDVTANCKIKHQRMTPCQLPMLPNQRPPDRYMSAAMGSLSPGLPRQRRAGEEKARDHLISSPLANLHNCGGRGEGQGKALGTDCFSGTTMRELCRGCAPRYQVKHDLVRSNWPLWSPGQVAMLQECRLCPSRAVP